MGDAKTLNVSAIVALLASASPAHAFENGYRIEIETGAVWQSLNDAQSPARTTAASLQGSRFSIKELQGPGPESFARLLASYTWGDRHQIHALYAPLSIAGTGAFTTPVFFQGEMFAANLSTTGRYRFDSYRFGYRYRILDAAQWQIWGGVTVKVRDANISLAQNAVEANRANTGFVPLLSLNIRRGLDERWSAILDVEGLAAPQGRAIDAAIKVRYAFSNAIGVSAGYRTLEGGADNENVYTFSWLHYGLLSLDYQI